MPRSNPSVPPPNPALRGFWLLAGSVVIALGVCAAAMARAHGQLGWVEGWVEDGARPRKSARAQRAIDSWLRPWVETFLRERGKDAQAADDLERCAAGFLVAMDRASDTANVVRIEPIEQAARRAVECARSPVGERDAGSFVQALRTRWGDGLQDEGASTGSGPGPRR